MIPQEIREKRNKICSECKKRDFIARVFDMHIDWVNCPYNCENDFEHIAIEMEREERHGEVKQ